jgi:coatomer subunit beta'
MVMLISEIKQGILQVVAVIRLSGSVNINDRMFHGEVKITMMAQHQNIVRFLGNCSYTAKQALDGKTTSAEIQERLLCFEYLSNGSLKKHLSGTIKKKLAVAMYALLFLCIFV